MSQGDRVEELLAALTLEEKAALTGGDDVWHLPAVERLGLGRLKVSDGPSGVRGERMGTRQSLSFPCGMAAGATWDVDLLGRYGAVLAEEARAKGVHVLLGPTVCIPRTPLAGRTFESFAEDPHLSARLTVAYVRGVQGGGVGCCVKHFACNDQEHERMTISAEVDERTLREVHLPSFEAAVGEAGAWSVMSAYNRVNGTYCGEHPRLLGEILKGEWGFDGVVISDWFGTHSTVEAAVAGLDVEMPGPPQHLGGKLAAAVAAGEVDEVVLDDHVRRILLLAERAGLLASGPPAVGEEQDPEVPARRRVARELAVAGTVLLRNDGLLPLAPDVRRVAVIGPNADLLETGGGGSSSVVPHRLLSFVDELRDRLPDAEITYERGCSLARGVPMIDGRLLDGGMRLEHFVGTDFEGAPLVGDRLLTGRFVALGDPAPGIPVTGFSLRGTATFRPDATGPWQLGVAATGPAHLLLDGTVLVDLAEPSPGGSFFGLGSETVTAEVSLAAGEDHELVVELVAAGLPIAGVSLHAGRPPVADELERAVAAATEADAVVVVVGANAEWESEGADRPDLRLIGDQDELVRRVLAANPRTAVVVNAGAPVELPWADDAGAVLTVWYPGEEGAPALADVVSGVAEPGGRLPITFPRRVEDTPTGSGGRRYPGEDGRVEYGEGLLVGYRHYDAAGVEPHFPFGHGLSYTTFSLGEPSIDDRVVTVPVTNTGDRRGSEVVQLYVGAPTGSGPDRPPKELRAFAKVTLDPGETAAVRLVLDDRAYAVWDGGWTVPPGERQLHVGVSATEIRHTLGR